MKKPSKTPKVIRKDIESQTMHIFDLDTKYTPDDLRRVANVMDEEGVINVMVELDYSGAEVVIYVLETQEKANRRYKIEHADWVKWEERQRAIESQEKERLIKRAKELGLIVTDKLRGE